MSDRTAQTRVLDVASGPDAAIRRRYHARPIRVETTSSANRRSGLHSLRGIRISIEANQRIHLTALVRR